jgi:hypothetical protein
MFPKRQTYCEAYRAEIRLEAEYVVRMSSMIGTMMELWNDWVRSGV